MLFVRTSHPLRFPISLTISGLYDGYESPHFKERILPSGTFELVFNLHDDELRIYKAAQPDHCEGFSGAIVSGPYNGFFVTDNAEEACVMGAHFKPGEAFPFLGLAADELADAHIDLETVWERGACKIRERLSALESPCSCDRSRRQRCRVPLEDFCRRWRVS
jgi:hypothetical protein